MSRTNRDPNAALIFLIWWLMRQISMEDIAKLFGIRKQTAIYHAENELLRLAKQLGEKKGVYGTSK